MRVYFAHPFQQRSECRRIQRQLESEIGIELFNPYYDDSTRQKDTERLNGKSIFNKLSSLEIDSVTDHECQDYIDNVIQNINRCEMVLAFPGEGYYEIPFIIMLARLMGKKICVVTKTFRDCPWFRVYSDYLLKDWGAAKEFLASRLVRRETRP